MLRPRIVPFLLIRDGGLVKTVKFHDGKYVGDPINAVRIFNEQKSDELVVLDIDATAQNREIDYRRVEIMASECRMPLCYGGGIKTVDQIKTILNFGVEKVALSSVAIQRPEIISEAANVVGSQSVTVVLDINRKLWGGYECFTHNGTRKTGKCPIEFAQDAQRLGAGEIVISSIDADGGMAGYDLELVKKVSAKLRIPLTVIGGAGSLQDIQKLIEQEHIIGAGAGSLFVFNGRFKAVLINYPTESEKKQLFEVG